MRELRQIRAGPPGRNVLSPGFDLPITEVAAAVLAARAYRIALVAFAIPAVIAAVVGFRVSLLWGVTALAVTSATYAAGALTLVIALKAFVAVFRIADYANEIAEQEATIAVNTAGLNRGWDERLHDEIAGTVALERPSASATSIG